MNLLRKYNSENAFALKIFKKKMFEILVLLILSITITAQNKNYQTVFNVDSLVGFNESDIKQEAFQGNMFGEEFKFYLSKAKRNYIDQKYNLSFIEGQYGGGQKLISNQNQIMATCTNMGFETGNLSGWTTSHGTNANSNTMLGCCPISPGNVSILNDSGNDPITGTSLNSPFAGNFVCQVNNSASTVGVDRISQTFNVTPQNALLLFAYKAFLDNAGHNCYQEPFLDISLLDCNNSLLACPKVHVEAPSGCPNPAPGFHFGNGCYWTANWQMRSLDLTPFIGSCVTLQITVGDCLGGAHFGYAYFDAECRPMNVMVNNVPFPIGTNATNITACGVSSATVSAPPYTGPYLWNGPIGSGVINVANQTFTTTTSGMYTLSMNPIGACAPIIRLVNLQFSNYPIANFNFSITPCSNVNTTSVVSTSSLNGGAPIINYTWLWGNALQTSSLSSAIHTYTSSGTYTVALITTNAVGCSDTATQVISLTQKPIPNFTVNSACLGSSFTFTNTSILTNSNTYVWNFGNSSPTVTTTHPNYIYPNTGNYTVTLIAQNSDGCIDSIKKPISVFALPIANFNFTVTPCTNTKNIHVNSTSNLNGGGPITNYNWNWGDATPTVTLNPVNHIYTTSGSYQVQLTISNSNGCKDSIVKTAIISQKPTANFTVNAACFGAPLNFTNTSITPIGTNISTWNFGDLSTSNAINPSHNYATSGNFSVTLVVTNTDGCKDSINKVATVYGRAVVDFTPTGVCFNTATLFTNLTSTLINPNTGSITLWTWNFGTTPLSSSSVQTPIFTYTNPANAASNFTYNATLFATTNNGCKDSVMKNVIVYSLPIPNFVSDSVCLGSATTLSFTGNANGNPLSAFSWDFNNNGIVDHNTNSISTTTVFPNFGNTAVGFTVYTNPSGSLTCQKSIIKNVWVHPIPNSSISNTNTCINTQPSLVSGVNSTIAIGTITNYSWNYGNGNTSTTNQIPQTSFNYINAGNYIITLTVTSNKGCSSTKTTTIEIWEKPFANFKYSKTCLTKQTTFTATPLPGSGTIVTYNWDFNNTPITTEASGVVVSTTYTSAGTQSVNMLLTTDKGCKNIISGNAYVNHNPKPNFTAPKRKGCADLLVAIKDSSAITGPAKNDVWQWYFDNQTIVSTDNNQNIITFSNPSNNQIKTYTVKLILISDSGCVDSIIKNNYITVYPNPAADFIYEGSDGDVILPTINFTNTSLGASKWQWSFSDGINSIDSIHQHPSHYFNTDVPTAYNVFLAVRNSYGCKDTIMKPVHIGADFSFYIPNTFTPNGDGINDIFTGKGVGIKTYTMYIFDRWGEKIFNTSDIQSGWDGSMKGKTFEDPKDDVYQWQVLITDYSNKVHQFVGHVTLMK